MFEESCLTCGKTLVDDSWRAYCSNQCMPASASPSSSSPPSSAYSSPRFFPGYPKRGHVSALSRNTLGSDPKYYDVYTASSSASSASWSAETMDEQKPDDGDDNAITPSSYQHISQAEIYYARRPSMTANLPTMPLLHTCSSLGVTPSNPTPFPQSAPHGSFLLNSARAGRKSGGYPTPDSGTSSADGADIYQNTAKAKRNRNRVSLPAYFSLMKIGYPSKEDILGGSPTARQLSSSLCSPSPTLTSVVALPSSADSKSSLIGLTRGRRREVGVSRVHPPSSPSRSPPRNRREHHIAYTQKNSMEKVSEWSQNVIPQPKTPTHHVILSSDGMQRHVGNRRPTERRVSPRRSSRGRAHIDELEGLGTTEDAPGYGRGRSGLLKRERRTDTHRRWS